MNLPAIYHRPTPEYIYPAKRTALTVRLTAARKDLNTVNLYHWPRYETNKENVRFVKMEAPLRDYYHDYFTATVETQDIAAYFRYYFELICGSETLWLGENGFSSKQPELNDNFFEFLWPNQADGYATSKACEHHIYYQIFPERFRNGNVAITPIGASPWDSKPTRDNFMGGDIEGIIQGLDYIQSLGATCLYLTPIFKAPSNHKYDTTNYYEVDPAFGTKDELHRLVREVHKRGLKIILDGVFNHCGYYWPPFQDVIEKGERSPYSSWFYPHSYPITLEQQNYDCVGHYKLMPKINLHCLEVAEYFVSVGEYWIRDFDIDGWRLDVADEVPCVFWQYFSYRIRQIKPDALLLGETWTDAQKLVTSNRLDTAMNYLFRDAVVGWIGKGTMTVSKFDHCINKILALYPKEVSKRLYNPLDSHDTPRFLFECQGELRRFRLGVALQMTLPGCPAVFYGDEIGLSGGDDPMCRQPMQWNEEKQDQELLDWYRSLIALRKKSPSLYEGDYRTVYCNDACQLFVFARYCEEEKSIVAINAGPQKSVFPLPEGKWREWQTNIVLTGDTEIPEYSVKIYQIRKGEPK